LFHGVVVWVAHKGVEGVDAKRIAGQAYPDYTIGTPSQGSINVNNTAYFVWIVPLTKDNTASKTIYIDVDNGNIVKEY